MPNDAGKLVSGVRLNSSGGNILEALKLADAVRYAKRLARDNELLLVVGADVTHSARGKMGAAMCCPRVVLLTAAAASAAAAAVDRQPHDALAGFGVDPVAAIGAPPVVSEGGNTTKKDKRNQEYRRNQIRHNYLH